MTGEQWERAVRSLESIAESLRKIGEKDWGTDPDKPRESRDRKIWTLCG